jgi:hypothetical protein
MLGVLVEVLYKELFLFRVRGFSVRHEPHRIERRGKLNLVAIIVAVF